MKYSKLNLISLCLVSGVSSAAVPSDGWYAGIMGTGSYAPSVSATHTIPILGVPYNTNLAYMVTGGGGGQIGYRICNFRFEGEALANFNLYNKVTFSGLTLKRHYTNIATNLPLLGPTYLRMKGYTGLGAGIFNAYYEFYDEDDEPMFIPYLGLGLGYAYVQNKFTVTGYNDVFGTNQGTSKGHKSSPLLQLIAGTSYFFTDYLGLSLDYRYLTTRTIKIGLIDNRIQLHTINLGLNYSFDV